MHHDRPLNIFQQYNLPYFVHRPLSLTIPMPCLIAIGPMTMTIVMARMAPPPPLRLGDNIAQIEGGQYRLTRHRVVYLRLIW